MKPIISIMSDDSVTVFVGGKPFVVDSENPRYAELKSAIANLDHDLVKTIACASDALTKLLAVYGDVQVFAGHVTFQGRPVGNYLVDKMLALINAGRDPEPYGRFLDRVMRNPNQLAIKELYGWCERAKLPILPDGRFLAYKRVLANYKSVHDKKTDNSPGRWVEMPRQEMDPDSQQQCSSGLHFCSQGYLSRFSGEVFLMLAVDPMDVGAFPDDANGTKGRACRYESLFEIDGKVAMENKFFDGMDEHVFTATEHYVRLDYARHDCAVHYDDGYRIVWDRGDDEWSIIAPDGSVYGTYDLRAGALAELAKVELPEIDVVLIPGVAEQDPDTFNSRLERLEDTLDVHPDLAGAGTFADRLDEIEDQLGLSRGIPPQIDRLVRAEQAAGI